jgi:archaellum component FlaC
MTKLTSKQINEVANNFLALAQTIGDFRYMNYDTLTKTQNKNLRESHKRTLNYSDDLYTISASLVMDDVHNSLAKLESITKKIKKLYKSLEDIHKIINVATSVVTLGASIFSLNPQAISESISKLSEIIE